MDIPAASVQSDQFMQLLLAQLESQDPLSPVNSDQFVSQLAQLTSVSNLEKLNTNFESLIGQQDVATGAALLGKETSVEDSSGGVTWKTIEQIEQSSSGMQVLLSGGGIVPVKDLGTIRLPQASS